ncbi:MAG TPA: alkaline phosphatase D family protein [Solirubrobacterales bacterium]|nr:alkaline phosphatase D family protein [Solirubrobacterales bacterium]
MAGLLLGPLLRYLDETQATIWVETDSACEVEVLGRTAPTFCICGHHYALVQIEGLEPGSATPYDVRLDGDLVWPDAGSELPPSLIRTVDPAEELKIAFGSCRVTMPHEAPYNRSKDESEEGRGNDALRTYALRMLEQDSTEWPRLLFMIGDQVYADEDAPITRQFIRERRGIEGEPGLEVADFEEYTQLYRESWSDPVVRWLFSTVGVAMLFDDHDVHDDWNISIDWLEEMRAKPWWDARITGALVSYWIYQHVGNLSPNELRERGLLGEVHGEDDAWPKMRDWAREADSGSEGRRWSYSRNLGGVAIVFMDSREGRVLGEKPRRMFDDEEWDWITESVRGDCDHLIVADTLPVVLPPAMHYLEAWNEAVCDGAWGPLAARVGEKIRRALDLEHWGAFQHSFRQLLGLIGDVGAGRCGEPPASIVMLGGDIHHAYLAEVAFRRSEGVRSPVWQAVCSPYRNPLDGRERSVARFGSTRTAELIGKAFARSAGVPGADVRWRLVEPPTFDNQIGTLSFEGRRASLRLERATPGDEPSLETSLERRLA